MAVSSEYLDATYVVVVDSRFSQAHCAMMKRHIVLGLRTFHAALMHQKDCVSWNTLTQTFESGEEVRWSTVDGRVA